MKVSKKADASGIGVSQGNTDRNWLCHDVRFQDILARLNARSPSPVSDDSTTQQANTEITQPENESPVKQQTKTTRPKRVVYVCFIAIEFM